MKRLLFAALVFGFAAIPPVWAAQGLCLGAIKASVEVGAGEFSLADLLAPDACPALLQAAAGVDLGSAPLAGSARVLDGNQVRAFLRKVTENTEQGTSGFPALQVPERITVRLAGGRASCAEIGMRILPSLKGRRAFARSSNQQSGDGPPFELDCAAADRIPQGSPVGVTRAVWNPVLGNWEVAVRCVHAGDCVPFLVRVRTRGAQPETERSHRQAVQSTRQRMAVSSVSALDRASPSPADEKPLVYPGDRVSLLWDQDGIRLVVPAVCLDRGGPGEAVRARMVRGGRLVRAIVLSAARLRAAS